MQISTNILFGNSPNSQFFGDNPLFFTSVSMYFISYFLMGFYLFKTEQNIFESNKFFFWGSIFLLSGFAIALITGLLIPYLGKTAWRLVYNYLNPLVVIMSISLAVLVKTLFTESKYISIRFLEGFSTLVLGIYVIHPIWIDILKLAGFSTSTVTPLIGIPVISLATFMLSAFSAYLLHLIPGLRRTI